MVADNKFIKNINVCHVLCTLLGVIFLFAIGIIIGMLTLIP